MPADLLRALSIAMQLRSGECLGSWTSTFPISLPQSCRLGPRTASDGSPAAEASLRARSPLWGVRDIDKVAEVAGNEGLVLEEAVPMPANNFTVVWRKSNGAFPGVQDLMNGFD